MVYLAKKDGKVIGGVAQVAGPTYDKGKWIVGVKLDGEKISDMGFLVSPNLNKVLQAGKRKFAKLV